MKPVSVMIVEDSLVVSEFLRHIIDQDPRLRVVAVARSGEEALDALPTFHPDVISLDIRLPGMNGFEVTKRVMSSYPTPIVVVSSDVEDDELKISMNSLRAGALAVVQKPVGLSHADYEALASGLCTKLLIMSQVRVIRQRYGGVELSLPPATPAPPKRIAGPLRAMGLVASTGGPSAVVKVLSDLDAENCPPIFLVQHITPGFVPGFVSWLNDVVGKFKVVEATPGTLPQPGTVYVAPADRHLACREGGILHLVDGDSVSGQKPSGSVLFASMAKVYGAQALGLILTGMGEDGAAGLKDMHDKGAFTIAEHESSAVVYGMPGAAVRFGAASEVLPLEKIGARINNLLQETKTK